MTPEGGKEILFHSGQFSVDEKAIIVGIRAMPPLPKDMPCKTYDLSRVEGGVIRIG